MATDRRTEYLARVGAVLEHEFGCAQVTALLGNYINGHGQPPMECLLVAESTGCTCRQWSVEETNEIIDGHEELLRGVTFADDLATLRETVWEIAGCGDIRFSHDIDRAKAEHEAARRRVEAEIARLERENEHLHLRIQRKNESLNAAEAEAARLREGLRRIDRLAGEHDCPLDRIARAQGASVWVNDGETV